MNRSQEVIALFDKLAELPRADAPDIEHLLARCPELARSDWINRYGPIDVWDRIAAVYSTPTLSWLIRVLVVAERELRWAGGSVAEPIWLFRAHMARTNGDADALAAWIFQNSGNSYLPFGSMVSRASSLAEWRAEQAMKPIRAAAHEEQQRAAKTARAERLRARKERAEARTKKGPERKHRIEERVAALSALAPEQRLTVLALDSELPLEAVPADLIESSLVAAALLPADIRLALLRRLDRRQSKPWKQLRGCLAQDRDLRAPK